VYSQHAQNITIVHSVIGKALETLDTCVTLLFTLPVIDRVIVLMSSNAAGVSIQGVNSVVGMSIKLSGECDVQGYRGDYDAAVVIAGAAGVNFSDVVWGQQSQEDIGIRASEEGKFRDIIWDQYVANRILARMEETDAQNPRRVASLVLSSVQDFHSELKKYIFKSLTPIVRATILEVVNGLTYSLQQRGHALCTEDDKVAMGRLLMRWSFCNRQFNILVGSMLRKNLMLQDGTMSTLRRTNEVNAAVSRNNVRMKQFIEDNLGKVQIKFRECRSENDAEHHLVVDWERHHNEARHVFYPDSKDTTEPIRYIAPGEHSLRPVNDNKRDRASDEGDRADAGDVAPKKRSVYASRFGF
jgi:hypothetical protein